MEILKVILSVIVIALAGYGLITKNFEFMPYMILFLGVFMLVTGISELQAKKKTSAIFFILAAAFLFFVAIYTLRYIGITQDDMDAAVQALDL